MNYFTIVLLLGVTIGITFMLLVCFIVFTNDNETIFKLQNALIKKEKENLKLRNVIEKIAEEQEDDKII